MAKRIQMRKQRFMAIQKIAEQKKVQLEGGQQAAQQAAQQQQQQQGPPDQQQQQQQNRSQGPQGGPPSEHGHSHGGHGHSHQHPHAPKQSMGNRQMGGTLQSNQGSRGCSIVGPLFQEVRFKVHDPKAHSKGGTLENTINGGRGQPPAPGQEGGRPPNPPDEEAGAPQHLIHPGKVSKKVIHVFIY